MEGQEMDEIRCSPSEKLAWDGTGTEAYEDHVERLTAPMYKLNNNLSFNIDLLSFSNAFGGEAGELQNIVKKIVKKDAAFTPGSDLRDKFLLEAGDALWYLTKIVMLMGYSLEEVMQANIEKLDARKLNNDAQKQTRSFTVYPSPFES